LSNETLFINAMILSGLWFGKQIKRCEFNRKNGYLVEK